MTSGAVVPDEATFLARRAGPPGRAGDPPAARRRRDPGRASTRKLAGGPGTFLLESAEQGAGSAGTAWSRYSFIGVRSAATLVERDGAGRLAGHAAGGRTGRMVIR